MDNEKPEPSEVSLTPAGDVYPVVRAGYVLDEWGDWELNKRGRPLRRAVLVSSPKEYRGPVIVYDNGAIRADDGSGYWIVPGPNDGAVTADRAREIGQIYRDRGKKAFLAGMARAKLNNPLRAWGWIAEQQTLLAGDIERGRASTEAAKFVGRAAGILDDREAGENSGDGLRDAIGAAVAAELVRYLRARSAGEL